MILTASRISGLPGNAKVISYSPKRPELFYEGVTVAFENEKSENWVGNFDDEHLGTRLAPIFHEGITLVFAGPYCYVVAESDSYQVIESYNSTDEWLQCASAAHAEERFFVIGSRGGKILVLDPSGQVRAETGLGICEDIKFANTAPDLLSGKYYEFNLKKWVDFKFTLPDLIDKN